MVLNIVYL